MKKIIIKLLAFFAKNIIKKYQPKIIGITGSVGKTSTKDFVANILNYNFKIRASIKNYNNEFGLPLTIIGEESPGKNILGWIRILIKAKALLLFRDKNYPEVLVLEMGIDRGGDMDYLLSIAPPNIGIITNISHSHVEYFGSVEKIKKEKAKLVKGLQKDGTAILNFDNKYLKDLPSEIKSRTITYGLNERADFIAKDIIFTLPVDLLSGSFYGINFKLEHKGSVIPVNLPGAISYPAIYSSLAALATGFSLNLNLVDIIKNLKMIPKIPGRMMVLPGIKKSIIIDDTYNSSPESSLSALKTIEKIDPVDGKKIVVFGDMLELGHYTEEGHRVVGKKMVEAKIDLIFLIGERARDIGRGAISAGFNKKNIFNFANIDDVKGLIKDRISSGDLILLKASQGVRLEKLVKELMNYPEKAEELLVRQGKEWQ